MADPPDLAVVSHPAGLTNAWLTAVLDAAVLGFSYERIGTGQVSDCYRIAVHYAPGAAGPASVILKVARQTRPAGRPGRRWGCTTARCASTASWCRT